MIDSTLFNSNILDLILTFTVNTTVQMKLKIFVYQENS